MAAWIKPRNLFNPPVSNPRVTVAGFERIQSGQMGLAVYHPSNPSIYKKRFSVALRDDAANQQLLLGDSETYDGNWHHVAFVRNIDEGTVSLYVDGKLDHTSYDDVTTVNINDVHRLNMYIGANHHSNVSGGIDEFFQGEIDELRIYGRTLSAEEVEQLQAENIQMYPDPVDFGTVSSALTGTITKPVGLSNAGSQQARVTSMSVSGDEADQFEILGVGGVDFPSIVFPFPLNALYSTTVEVGLTPTVPPADGYFNADLLVTVEDDDGNEVTVSVALVATLGDDVLSIDLLDARQLIVKIDQQDRPLDGNGTVLTEALTAHSSSEDERAKRRSKVPHRRPCTDRSSAA